MPILPKERCGIWVGVEMTPSTDIKPCCNTVDRTVLYCTDNTVFVVVDSHIQRVVLATEEATVTRQVSHIPIKCQSRLWSQRGTKVNGSHHGDNPLLTCIVILI